MILYRGDGIHVEYTNDRIHFRLDTHAFRGPFFGFKPYQKVHDPVFVLTVESLWGTPPGDGRSIGYWGGGIIVIIYSEFRGREYTHERVHYHNESTPWFGSIHHGYGWDSARSDLTLTIECMWGHIPNVLVAIQ